jgi:hypothetical protein
MNNLTVGRERDGLGRLNDTTNVLFSNFPVTGRDGHGSPAVKTFDVGTGEPHINRLHHGSGLLFGILYGFSYRADDRV